MGSINGMSCSHCDFKIILEGIDSFYVDHNTDELIEYILLMMTRIDEDNKMSGHIERTYCPDCDKLIKTYIIAESKYSEEEGDDDFLDIDHIILEKGAELRNDFHSQLKRYQDKYNNHKTKLLSCVGLADIIEEGNEEKIKKYLKDHLSRFRGKIKNVVLRLYTLSINTRRDKISSR